MAQAFYVFAISALISAPFAIKGVMNAANSDIINALYFAPIRFATIVTLFLSYRFASINILMPMGYLRLPIMAVMVYFSMGKMPSISTAVCGLLIVAVNIILLWHMSCREHKRI